MPWLSHVIGSCWRSELSKGETRDRQCFSLQFGKVVRVEQTIDTLKDEKVVATLLANSVYAWDPRMNKLRHVFWGSDGSFESATGWADGEALVLVLDRETDAKGDAPARTVFHRTGPNVYCVAREERQGNRWAPLFAFTYERDGGASDPSSSRPMPTRDKPLRDCGR